MTVRRLAPLSIALVAACIGGGKRPGLGSADAGSDAPLVVASVTAPVKSATPDAAPPDPAVLAEKGKALYGKYCDFCHGETGKGYAADEAPALASDDLLTLASDEYLEQAILKGRPGTTMSAWGITRGGPLGVDQAKQLVAYLRTWQKGPSVTIAPRGDAGTGDAARGAPIYAAKCLSCHGKDGHGGKYNALANAELLAAVKDEWLAATIERGRAGTQMASWAGKLSSADVDDLVALIRSWQKPAEEAQDLPPRPGALKSVVINPGGPAPAFDPKADFVPVDTVKKELDRKATMVIVDARAPGDYALMHVAGAISVPFYEVQAYAPQIPKNAYILTYCACPHAASVKARDALRLLGYSRVAVLDEGINVWRDRGYPVRGSGHKP